MGGKRVKYIPSSGRVLPLFFNFSFYDSPYMHLPLNIKTSDLKVQDISLPLFSLCLFFLLSDSQDPGLGIKDSQES